jgi:endonuclease/exonuclease/phosphatase (EEP) superfamily protein YafD
MSANFQQIALLSIALIKILLNLLALLAAIATILGFFGRQWWISEALDHPRVQYSLILAIALIVGLISREKWSLSLGVPLAINLVTIVPFFFPPNLPGNSNSPALIIFHANLDRQNPQPDRAIEDLSSQTADIIFLQEVTPAWLNKLNSELKKYRIHTVMPSDDSLGVAMLLPIAESPNLEIVTSKIVHIPADSPRRMLEVTVLWQGKEIAILSASTARGTNGQGASNFQKNEFDEIAKWSVTQQQEFKREVIAIGDLNNTPWSDRFRQFVKDSNLINSQIGFGWQTTWPANLPPLLRIPIDHCLHSKSLKIAERSIGSNIGSDHLPLLVKLLYND